MYAAAVVIANYDWAWWFAAFGGRWRTSSDDYQAAVVRSAVNYFDPTRVTGRLFSELAGDAPPWRPELWRSRDVHALRALHGCEAPRAGPGST
jgi:hypothetical protein